MILTVVSNTNMWFATHRYNTYSNTRPRNYESDHHFPNPQSLRLAFA
jgi:hypothetical protein